MRTWIDASEVHNLFKIAKLTEWNKLAFVADSSGVFTPHANRTTIAKVAGQENNKQSLLKAVSAYLGTDASLRTWSHQLTMTTTRSYQGKENAATKTAAIRHTSKGK
jgi:hypothetical protein